MDTGPAPEELVWELIGNVQAVVSAASVAKGTNAVLSESGLPADIFVPFTEPFL